MRRWDPPHKFFSTLHCCALYVPTLPKAGPPNCLRDRSKSILKVTMGLWVTLKPYCHEHIQDVQSSKTQMGTIVQVKYKRDKVSQLPTYGPWGSLRFVAVVFFLFSFSDFFCSNPHSHREVFTCLCSCFVGCFHFRIACLCGSILETLLRSHGTNRMAVIMSDFLIFWRFRGLARRTLHKPYHRNLKKKIDSNDVTHDAATHLLTQILSRSERASMRWYARCNSWPNNSLPSRRM